MGGGTNKHLPCPSCFDSRDTEEKYELITKTDAKNQYLLKDVDFDLREPPLKFILRKNPHNERWGDMKLFLEFQVIATFCVCVCVCVCECVCVCVCCV